MTDTLIARLRDMAFAPYSPKLMLEAADRIEALQAELTEEQEEVATLWKQVAAMAEREIALQARLTALESQEPVAWMVYAKGSRRYFTLTFDVNKVPEIYVDGEALPLFLAAGAAPTKEPYDKTEMNAFVTKLYKEKITTAQHGFYETLFHVVHQAIKRATTKEQT